ncbi:MAG: sugar kinase [Spirochaetales bacterium]|nr:sugar kinase [Spirochaetales bacterium]
MKSILVIGEILVEIMADQTDQSFLEAGSYTGPFASGAPAIFIDQAAKFQVPAAILSAVGDDDFGRLCLTRLAADGVNTNYIKTVQNRATGVAFVRYNSDGSRNFIYHIGNAACGQVTTEDLDGVKWEDLGVFHIMGSSIFTPEMFTLHREALNRIPRDCIISLDPNVRPEILKTSPDLNKLIKELLNKAEILFATEEEMTFLTGTDDVEAALTICFSKGLKAVIVKRGGKGASLFTEERRIDAPGLDVVEIDPTGAGDTFAGAFMAGYLKGWPLEECLTRANTAGASAVGKRGPMEGTIRLEEL